MDVALTPLTRGELQYVWNQVAIEAIRELGTTEDPIRRSELSMDLAIVQAFRKRLNFKED